MILGCLMCWLFATVFILAVRKVYNKKEIHYEQYPIIEADVMGTHDFNGDRWMVRFRDESGREVIAADDTSAESTFSPEKHAIPKRGTSERVYLWAIDYPTNRSISGMPIMYYFHFCNEEFYALSKMRNRRRSVALSLAAIALYIVGAVLLFK